MFSIFLQVYAALIAHGYTRRVNSWVDGKVVEVLEREENSFAYHSSYFGWTPINPACFRDLMFAERYTIEMRVKALASGLDLYGKHFFPIKLRLNRDLPLNYVGKYAGCTLRLIVFEASGDRCQLLWADENESDIVKSCSGYYHAGPMSNPYSRA